MPSTPSSWIPTTYHLSDLSAATVDDLRRIVRTFPIIDNHAHNLLQLEKAQGNSDVPFESITSEAQGAALTEHFGSTLSHIRAVNDLAAFFGCAESWAEIVKYRNEWVRQNYEGLIQKCFAGIHGIMMDDGLNADVVQPYEWHRQFVPRISRVVRIEAIAAKILEQLVRSSGINSTSGSDLQWDRNSSEALFIRFNGEFRNQIRACSNDPNVRGFKSVVCYRTGLDVSLSSRKILRPQHSLTESDLLVAFHNFVLNAVRKENFRIEEKAFNDYLVVAVCDVLTKRVEADGERLPFQFHTGLGDSDINLVQANPAYLQNLIAAFPDVDFVLLHSSYPYTKEAGYLASAYSNAYLDIGEVFPMLSRDGQESVIKEALDLAPASKVLWSTDGHFFPETYWLANKQFREAFEKVLVGGVSIGDYNVSQAINIAVDIYFFNSNRIYGLAEEAKYPQLFQRCGRNPDTSAILSVSSSQAAISGSKARPVAEIVASQESSLTTAASSDLVVLLSFLAANPEIKYIWLQIMDYTSTLRCRMIPIASFISMVRNSKYPSLTNGVLRILQTDQITDGGTATGQFQLQPDLSTLATNTGHDAVSISATCETFWLEDGTKKSLEGCPRSTLRRFIELAKSEFDISFLMGFEIEICFVQRTTDPSNGKLVSFEPHAHPHAWNAVYPATLSILPIIDQIVSTLSKVGINLTMFHPEGAPGQWEFVLPPLAPLQACDMLLRTRRIISNVAFSHNFQATCYPRPYPSSCGTACHAHYSVSPISQSDSFLAGVLEHLPGILALSLPVEESYERVQGGIWAGGEWVGWGYQNKETPLRKIEEGHYEVKTVDGLANVYLAMAALIAAGLDGIRQKAPLTHKDCPFDPSQLTAEKRESYGITNRLPGTLEEALGRLHSDKALTQSLGKGFVENYLAVKRGEMAMLKGMGEDERRRWMIERY